MFDSIVAIKDFKQIVNYKKESTCIVLNVEAVVNGVIVYQGNTDCYISYDAGYEQYEVNIDWNISDEVMSNLGLHGSYNTKFQEMKTENNSLIIVGDNYCIKLSKYEK